MRADSKPRLDLDLEKFRHMLIFAHLLIGVYFPQLFDNGTAGERDECAFSRFCSVAVRAMTMTSCNCPKPETIVRVKTRACRLINVFVIIFLFLFVLVFHLERERADLNLVQSLSYHEGDTHGRHTYFASAFRPRQKPNQRQFQSVLVIETRSLRYGIELSKSKHKRVAFSFYSANMLRRYTKFLEGPDNP